MTDRVRITADLDELLPCGPSVARIWTCDACGRAETWREGWGWLGSWLQLDEGEPVLASCSERCRVQVEANARRLWLAKYEAAGLGITKALRKALKPGRGEV